jgi:hypothetical protein
MVERKEEKRRKVIKKAWYFLKRPYVLIVPKKHI